MWSHMFVVQELERKGQETALSLRVHAIQVPGQSELYRETLSQTKKTEEKREERREKEEKDAYSCKPVACVTEQWQETQASASGSTPCPDLLEPNYTAQQFYSVLAKQFFGWILLSTEHTGDCLVGIHGHFLLETENIQELKSSKVYLESGRGWCHTAG